MMLKGITAKLRKQPWLHSMAFDGAFILAPPLLIALSVWILRAPIQQINAEPAWLWLLLVVGVDVSHVYSTLFRTYFDAEEFASRRSLYTLTPLAVWIIGYALYSLGDAVFWRVLAYLAVFHFIRQQYGFLMMYARREGFLPVWHHRINKITIYAATLYPLLYWHCTQRDFNWFVADDFFTLNSPELAFIAGIAYVLILLVYIAKEAVIYRRWRHFNWPRNAVVGGTAVAWFVGIVAINNDIAFTATNVVSHGVPYLALVWLYSRNRERVASTRSASTLTALLRRSLSAWPFYLALLAGLAFIEEALWDGFIWREHAEIFMFSDALPAVENELILAWLVPLLSVPQITHYLLDAYIWRLRETDAIWKDVLFLRDRPGVGVDGTR